MAPNRYSFNMSFEFYRQFVRSAEIRVLTQVKTVKGVRPITYFDVRLNLCDSLSNFKSIPLLIDLYRELKKSFNVKLGCPIKAVGFGVNERVSTFY